MRIKSFVWWIMGHFYSPFLLVPLGARNIVPRASLQAPNGELVGVGFRDYYIFGIRVARLQKTAPWGQG